jgi:hypothetical protein
MGMTVEEFKEDEFESVKNQILFDKLSFLLIDLEIDRVNGCDLFYDYFGD